ncbi:putative Disease resistance protein (TIR-NBS-LRR class) [Quillaja saponaria]|uniref:ADP-ribosyl cyclase/cyclic ADP-ribose hydrolase n=1 Tax=Quillaja saponaria TaxID=32244 RepID=A0AAD7PQ96_QUISA|nr:putative Disease resistance protein (TIR-NBS-LRR class) [Quillaja saponaria]
MASSSSSAVSPSPTLEKHDVFISFRGEDTRRNFVSYLYDTLCRKKIKTYIDNDLNRGENISQALLQAIEESTVWVIIFSENYASSGWCLDELVKIVECVKVNRFVIPVFYNIDPSHVRHQTGSYGEAFALHKNKDKVEKWKVALTRTANLSGWDSQKYKNDVELIDAIVGDILKKLCNLHPSDSSFSSGLVGIEKQIAEIELLMSIESSNILMIGIWGMGGIGKTTIAGAIYNKLSIKYEGCCFLENVREELEKRGAKNLRNQFLSKLLGGEKVNIDTPHVESTSVIKRLQKMKVLVVLDDVSDLTQLEVFIGKHRWFGIGSRIVATTRDKQAISRRVDEIYEVKERKFDEARQIFCACAFQGNELPVDYMVVCDRVLDYANGVPLALKVLGSFLYGKSKKEWESALKKLKKTPNVDIQKVLRLSYDSLDHEEKDIFLDIAHHFKGFSINNLKDILDDFGYSADIGIRTLLDKCLINILCDDIISMHDLLAEMGLDVVRQECLNEPERRSRLQNSEETCHLLNNNKGTGAIEVIWLAEGFPTVQLRPDTFASMHKLRILRLANQYGYGPGGGHPSVGLKSLPNELR